MEDGSINPVERQGTMLNTLRDKDQANVSDNVYWIAGHNDFTALAVLDKVTLNASASRIQTDKAERLSRSNLKTHRRPWPSLST